MERDVWAKALPAIAVKQARINARDVKKEEGVLRRADMGPQATRRWPLDSVSEECAPSGKGEENWDLPVPVRTIK